MPTYQFVALLLVLNIGFRFCGKAEIIDTAKAQKMLRIAEREPNIDSAISLYQYALQISSHSNYPDGAASALFGIGLKYIDQGLYSKSIEFFKKAFPYCKKAVFDKELVALYYNNLALALQYQGDFEVANVNFHLALREFNKLSHTSSNMVTIYNNLATIQMSLHQYPQGLIYLNEGESIARRGKYTLQLGRILCNKGIIYADMNKPDSAKSIYLESLTIGTNKHDINLQVANNVNLGDLYLKNKKYRYAVSLYQKGIILSQKAGMTGAEIISSYSLGEAFYNIKEYSKGEKTLIYALKKAKAIKLNQEIIPAYTTLAKIYIAEGKLYKALVCKDKIIQLKDSLFSTEKTKAINQMEVKYRSAEKDRQITLTKLELAKKESDIAKKNLWIGGISAGAILLALVSIGLFWANHHKQNLQQHQIMSLRQEQEIGILKAMMDGEEKERSRIARELHDGIGGMLSAAIMEFISIRHDYKALSETPGYTAAMGLLGEMGNEIRKTSHYLMPEVLLKQSLPETVKSFCNHLGKGGNLAIDFQAYGDYELLSQDFKLTVYRIIQELVQNIVKHSEASYAFVQLVIPEEEDKLSITVEDNGIGFDTGNTKDGIGLHNLRTRVKALDGHFTLEAGEGKGTSVFVELPVVRGE